MAMFMLTMVADSMDNWPFNVKDSYVDLLQVLMLTAFWCILRRKNHRESKKMNRLVFFLALMPFASYSQGSWVSVEVQTDQYSAETTWDIVGDGEVWEESAPYFSNEFRQQVVFLPPGDYTFTVYDAFGDGICCSFGEGWFGLSNSCGLDTAVYDFNSSSFQIEFSLYPCPPPIFGCMSPGALDFNPWATMPGPCNFPPQQCEEGENNIVVTVVPDTYAGETSWDTS